jgi:hypothetical protein
LKVRNEEKHETPIIGLVFLTPPPPPAHTSMTKRVSWILMIVQHYVCPVTKVLDHDWDLTCVTWRDAELFAAADPDPL